MIKTQQFSKKVKSLFYKTVMLTLVSVLSFPLWAEKKINNDAVQILPNLEVSDLVNADKWYYNEYRGGRNGDAYPHWDWSTDYMASLNFVGNWEEQNEGTTLRTRNDEADRTNPADLDKFDSFVYGSKKITADNKIMSLRIRTHAATTEAPAYFGVQVVDLSATTPTAIKIGTNQTYASENYADFHFDLSDYVGKEVVIAIGIYRAQTGDYWKQLVLRAIRFADQNVTDWNWLPGSEPTELTGWKLTQGMIRSTMPNAKQTFTGISPTSGSRDSYQAAYHSWRTVDHIASQWSLVPLFKDVEVFPSEGYLIKTRGNTPVNTLLPESYLYAKFAITSNNDEMVLKTRTFSSSNYTFFKVTAIKEDGTVTYLSPKSNTAQDAAAAENNCWKFKHDNGGAGNPDSYASFVYDLSQFNGNNVIIAISVHKGEVNSDENKIAFYSVTLQNGGNPTSSGADLSLDAANAYSPAKGLLTINYKGNAMIYDACGKLYLSKIILDNETFSMPSGFYIVNLDGKVYKTMIK